VRHPFRSTRLAAGLALALLTLWLAFRGTDGPALRHALSGVHASWLAAALLLVGSALATLVVRWRLLFHPDRHRFSWTALTAGIMIGQMVNILLPLRVGEIARAYLVSRTEGLPVSRVLTTIGVEKLADLVSMGVTAGALLVLFTTPAWLHAPGRAILVTGAIALGMAALLAVRAEAVFRYGLDAVGLVSRRWQERLGRAIGPGMIGLSALRNWRVVLAVWLLSVLTLIQAAGTNYVLFRAFELDVPATAAFVLLLALQVGNSFVSVPGNLGVFHYVTVLVLSAYSVDRSLAAGYALVLYVVALGPKIALGGFFMAAGYRWSVDAPVTP
jgi:uncharacterized protein (TIRG00374 family)